jgi:hypothetical protein
MREARAPARVACVDDVRSDRVKKSMPEPRIRELKKPPEEILIDGLHGDR